MSTAVTEPETLADVVHALGDIPLHRILWHPFPGTATEADQRRICDGEPKRLVELIDGVLVEKAMGHRESLFAASLIVVLGGYINPRDLGVYGAPDAPMRLRAGLIRLPDVYFTAWENLPSDDAHLLPVVDYPPDLAIEVFSAGNTKAEMARKRRDYFAAGSKVIWIFYPKKLTVDVFADPTRPDKKSSLTTADVLDGGNALPGFTLSLAEFFATPQLNRRQKPTAE